MSDPQDKATRRPGPTKRVRVVEWRGEERTEHEDRLATEEPLEVRIEPPGARAERFGVTMRTPGHDFELAAGLLLTEGVITDVDDLRSVAYCTDESLTRGQEFNVVTAHLAGSPRRAIRAQQMSATSACGVCGADSIAAIEALRTTPAPARRAVYSPAFLRTLPGRLGEHQRVFDSTGGIHAAGLFAPDGSLLVVREDVGRHNAVDKAIGHCLLHRIEPRDALLCTSGRIGFEIVQKAVVARMGAVVAVGAPSSLAIDLARRADIAVAGFVRGERLVVYHRAEDVVHQSFDPPASNDLRETTNPTKERP